MNILNISQANATIASCRFALVQPLESGIELAQGNASNTEGLKENV